MRSFAQIVLLASLSVLTSAALAFDNGQFENVPPDIRAWFKGVIAPNGVPCCDISDGHRTEYNFREGSYWVPIEGQWMADAAHAIIRDRGNPVGEAWCGMCITAAPSSSVASCRRMRGVTLFFDAVSSREPVPTEPVIGRAFARPVGSKTL